MQRNLLALCLTMGLSTLQLFSQTDLWVKTFGGAESQFPQRMDTDPDGNIYWVGHSYYNVGYESVFIPTSNPAGFFGKTDPEGDLEWIMHGGSTSHYHWFEGCNSIVHDQMNSLYIGGYAQGQTVYDSLSFTAVGDDIDAFIIKLTDEGDPLWIRNFSGDGVSVMGNMAGDAEGNVLALILFEDTVTYDNQSWVATANNNYNLLLVKIDSAGDLLWGQHFKQGDAYTNNFFGSALMNMDVIVSPSQAIYVTATYADTLNIDGSSLSANGPDTTFDIFVAKLSLDDGSPIWMRSFGGVDNEYSSSLFVHDDKVYVAGMTESSSVSFDSLTFTNVGPHKTFAVWFDTLNGLTQGGFAVSAILNNYFFSGPKLTVANNGDVLLGGAFSDSLVYGNNVRYDSNYHCMYIVRYDPDIQDYVSIIAPEINSWRSYVYSFEMVDNQLRVLGFFYTNYGEIFDLGNHQMVSAHYDGIIVQYGDCSGLNAEIDVSPEDEVLCQNEVGTLFANSSGLEGYQWLKNGALISNATFDSLSVSDSGFYQLVVDSSGCSDTSAAVHIIQAPQPTVTHDPIASTCDTYNPFVITGGNPEGGYYTGLGVENQTHFNPLVVPTGSNTIWYVYQDSNGCVDSTSENIVVYQSPAIFNLSFTACSNGSPINLATTGYGFPAGGSHSGPGVVGTQFIPSVAGAGTHSIFYSSAVGCLSSDSIVATVTSAPAPSLTAPASICESATTPALLVGSPSGGTYLWNNISSQLFYPSMAGTGNVMVTYSVTQNGCTGIDTAYIQVDTLPVVNLLTFPEVCEGGDSVVLSTYASPTGGVFTGQGVSGQYFDPSILGSGAYSIQYAVTNACGSASDSALITVLNDPSILLSASNVSCFGGNNGTASASSSSTVSYLWNTGSANASISGLSAGNYTVTVTDTNGCQSNASVEVLQPASALTAPTMARVNVSCNGGSNGSITANPTGGTSPYSYSWTTGGTTQSITGLSAGSYTVTITDANGCSIVRTRTITQPAVLNASISVVSPSCNGGSNGSATASTTGGTGAKTYAWNTGGTSATITGLVAGSYTVTVTDANGCTDIETATITAPTAVAATISATSGVSCFGGSDGGATASGSGGTSPYTYSWSGGSTTATVSTLSAGTHTVTATDANGCTATASTTITQPSTAVDVTISNNTSVSCNGGNNGSATASATGGTGTKTYVWSTGATTALATGLQAGTYTVTATDANGCTDITTVSISEPTALVASITGTTSTSCNGGSNGTATAAGTGGTSPYGYQWSSGSTSAIATGLAAGSYTVTITDANGCSNTATATVTEPSAVSVSITSTNSSCNGANDGSMTASASGGTSGYTYAWSTAATSSTITNLSPGTYTVTVTDANGCSEVASQSITEPQIMTVSASVLSNVSCFEGSDGEAIAYALGGTAPFSFSWSVGATTAAVSTLSAGTHTVTVTDASGCFDQASVSLSQPSSAVQSTLVSIDHISCFGEEDGTIEVSASGGTGSLSYQWSSGQNSAAITGLSAGQYEVVVTDQNGCTDSSEYLLDQPDAIEFASASLVQPSCSGSGDGGITVLAEGGVGGFSYAWSTGSFSSSSGTVNAGYHVVTVTDSSGCAVDSTIHLDQPDPLSINVVSISNSTCFESNDGSALISPVGGTAPYAYEWSTTDSTAFVLNLGFGNTTITVTDVNGCSTDTVIFIDQPDEFILIGQASVAAVCPNDSNAVLSAEAFGGTTPYELYWQYGSTTTMQDTLFNAGEGVYLVYGYDSNDCYAQDSITVGEFSSPIVTLNLSVDTICQGVEWIAEGGFPLGGTFFHQEISGGVLNTSFLSGDQSITYEYSDSNGCSASADDSLFVLLKPTAMSEVDSVALCPGEPVLLGAGQPSNGQYDSPFMIGFQLVAPASAYIGVGGFYTASNVCGTDSDTFYLEVYASPTLSLGSDTSICETEALAIELTNYSEVVWSTGDSSSIVILDQSNLTVGSNEVSVQVWNSNGCSAVDTMLLLVDSLVLFSLGEDVEICSDSTLLLTASGMYQNYTWNDGTFGNELLVEGSTIDSLGQQLFWVVGFNDLGCSYSDSIIVQAIECDSANGTNDLTQAPHGYLKIYPNPARHQATVEWFGPTSQDQRLQVFNVQGQLVERVQVSTESTSSTSRKYSLQWENLSVGMYLVHFSTKDGYITERLMVVE